MAIKIKIQPIDKACECPFYVTDTKDRKFCFIKQNLSVGQAISLVEDNKDFDSMDWNNDCLGKFENCAVLSLLYQFNDTAVTDVALEPSVVPETVPELVPVDSGISDYNPFEKYVDEDEVPVSNTEEKQGVKDPEPEIEDNKESINPDDYVKVRIHGVDNIYSVKVDALVYPTNQLLFIDDDDLNYRTHNQLQAELERNVPPIKLGGVYPSSNGGNHKGGVVAKQIYHAVVSTQSRLVNESAINKAVIKSLTLADQDGCKTVAMLPMDCGTFDLYQTAMAQLGAIYNYLQSVPVKNIRYVFIITKKDDNITLQAFNEYFDRIFSGG